MLIVTIMFTLCTSVLCRTSCFHAMVQIQIGIQANYYSPRLAKRCGSDVCYRRLPCSLLWFLACGHCRAVTRGFPLTKKNPRKFRPKFILLVSDIFFFMAVILANKDFHLRLVFAYTVTNKNHFKFKDRLFVDKILSLR